MDTLLELDGNVFYMENGYWVKIECRQVDPTSNIPHGVKYSLTLHDPDNQRILGYDNAHGVAPKNKRFAAHRNLWDHKHKQESVEHYEFESAGKLMEDFWNDVNTELRRRHENHED